MGIPERKNYLMPILERMSRPYPDNHTVHIVCHGHSVPAGYKAIPVVDPFAAYPHQLYRLVKERYPFASLQVIVTAVGGEDAVHGARRMECDVLCHKPDVLTIDYALNDRYCGAQAAEKAWREMIEKGLAYGCKILLMTPNWDRSCFRRDRMWQSLLEQAGQVRRLANAYGVGLVDFFDVFQRYEQAGGDPDDLLCAEDHPSSLGHRLLAREIGHWFPAVQG